MDATLSAFANAVYFGLIAIAAFGFAVWCVESIYSRLPATSDIKITQGKIAAWLDAHAAPEWRLAHRLRSVQIALFWAVLGGVWVALPSFQNYLSPFRMMLISIGFSVAILFARMTGQKGLPDA